MGDVMLGRGIDQIMPRPSHPALYEPWVTSAGTYVELAERANGPVPRAVDPAYVWGDALPSLTGDGLWARVINLETAITTSRAPAPKSINYKMHPANVGCLPAARIDACGLANNHVLDWGQAGLIETLETLDAAGLRHTGAGRNAAAATTPVALAPLALAGAAGPRLLVFAVGLGSSGIPADWAAGAATPGVAFLPDLSPATAESLVATLAHHAHPTDRVVVSIHWGGNWGHAVPDEQRRFAHALIDSGRVDLVHGHSAHHAKAFEIYRERLVLYGAGDFINDYEGITGTPEGLRDDLAVLWLADLDVETGRLAGLELELFRLRRLRLEHATAADREWLRGTLNRQGRPFATRLAETTAGRLRLVTT